MTRLGFLDEGTTAGGGGGPSVGDPVFLGPRYGEDVDLTVGVAVAGRFTTGEITAGHDTYLQELTPTVTAGAATVLLAKQTVPAAGNEERAFIAWDLTGLGSSTITSAVFRFAVETDALAAANAPWTLRTHPSQPFVESTATWGNSIPVPGTQRQSGTVVAPSNLLGPAWSAVSITANASARSAMAGAWVYLRFTGADGTGVNRIRIQSKEFVSPTQAPTLELAVTL